MSPPPPSISFPLSLFISQPNLKIKAVLSSFFAVTCKTWWVFLSELDIHINEGCTAVTANSDKFPSEECGVIFSPLHAKHRSHLTLIFEKNQ